MIQSVKRLAYEGLSRTVTTCDVRDTLIVAGAPRSGTTWLAELLRELPDYKFLNEPLFLPNHPEARRAGFGWRTHIPPRTENPTAEAFFSDVLTGKVPPGPLWHYRASSAVGRLVEQLTHRKLVVKFCRAGRLLHWLCERFEVRGTVMIIRHPCAVIASQLEHGAWTPEQSGDSARSAGAIGEIPERVRDKFGTVLEEVTTPLGIMTATWCLDYYIPLVEHAEGNYPWDLVSYEGLVLRGTNEMGRILSTLGAEMTDDIRSKLHEASGYASDDLTTKDPKKQVSKWRNRLSSEQIRRVLNIVSAFDLDFYTEDVEPQYEAMDCFR